MLIELFICDEYTPQHYAQQVWSPTEPLQTLQVSFLAEQHLLSINTEMGTLSVEICKLYSNHIERSVYLVRAHVCMYVFGPAVTSSGGASRAPGTPSYLVGFARC